MNDHSKFIIDQTLSTSELTRLGLFFEMYYDKPEKVSIHYLQWDEVTLTLSIDLTEGLVEIEQSFTIRPQDTIYTDGTNVWVEEF